MYYISVTHETRFDGKLFFLSQPGSYLQTWTWEDNILYQLCSGLRKLRVSTFKSDPKNFPVWLRRSLIWWRHSNCCRTWGRALMLMAKSGCVRSTMGSKPSAAHFVRSSDALIRHTHPLCQWIQLIARATWRHRSDCGSLRGRDFLSHFRHLSRTQCDPLRLVNTNRTWLGQSVMYPR